MRAASRQPSTGEASERWFELACVFWFGAVVPPLGAVLSALAIFERVRRRRLPAGAGLWFALAMTLPAVWLVSWGWREATLPRPEMAPLPPRPLVDPEGLDSFERAAILGLAAHAVLGALAGALWGARAGPDSGALVTSGIGAVAGSGWAWCAAGVYVLSGASRAAVAPAAGVLLVAFPVASLLYCHRLERSPAPARSWSRVDD